MKTIFHKEVLKAVIVATLGLFAMTGCDVSVGDDGGGYYSSGSYGGSSSYDETEDMLLVSGSGDVRLLEYNTLTFSAKLNWRDGDYYFAPDEDGTVSGNKIICRAAISDYDLEGDCFREGQVCHFSFYESYTSDSDKDAYYVSSNSCKTAGTVGPFLVPLDSPLCGEDPYPACPVDDLWPTAEDPETAPSVPATETQPTVIPSEDSKGDESSSTSLTPLDHIINTICVAATRCDATVTEASCIGVLNQYGVEGANLSIADNLGLESESFSSEEIRQKLLDGQLSLNQTAYTGCLHELGEVCDNGEKAALNGIGNVENLIVENGSCSTVLSIVDGGVQ
jgi:hypothetical protein